MINEILEVNKITKKTNFEYIFNFSKIEKIHIQSPSLIKIKDPEKRAKIFTELYEILTAPNVNTKVRSSIPCGPKEDVYFVLPNFNEGRYEKGLKFDHPNDDKGAFISSTKVWLFRLSPEGRVKNLGLLKNYKGEALLESEKVILKQAN